MIFEAIGIRLINEFEKLMTRRPAVPENIVQEMYTMGKSALERIYTKLNETESECPVSIPLSFPCFAQPSKNSMGVFLYF